MSIQAMNKIKDFYKNPIKLFGFLAIIFSFVLLFLCRFHFPNYYTNEELASQIAETVSPNEVSEAVKHLLNPEYKTLNPLFQIWGWIVTLFIFTVSFKVKEFKKFKELTILNQKRFVYLWINLSYFIWCLAYIAGYMADLDKYVYNGGADSMGIPYFSAILILTFIGIIYYTAINLCAFVTYNTKIKRLFYSLIWAFVLIFWIIIAYDSLLWKFTYLHLIINLYYPIWFIFAIYAIGYNKNK